MDPQHGCWSALLDKRAAALAAMIFALLPGFAGTASAEEFRIGGTGTALGTMRLLIQEYNVKHPQVQVRLVPNLGSGGGIKAVLAGAIDLAVASRPLKDEERQLGASASEYGRTPFVFVVASKMPIDAITREELAEIYAGSKTKWPDGSPIRVVLRPPSDVDSEMVKNLSEELRRAVLAAEQRPGVRTALNDQLAADDLERIPGAIGPSSLSLIISEKRALKALRLDGIPPAQQNLPNPAYPHFKRLFFVAGPSRSAAVEAFMAFVDSPAGRKILVANGHLLP